MAEKERPPWQMVITAPPRKVNKNALLKAKILDATRRALLAQKICHIGIQTEPTTSFVREKSIDTYDLIRKNDKAVDTDGVITIRRQCPRGCKFLLIYFEFLLTIFSCHFSVIITHTVAQMTDKTSGMDIGTQTALPKTNLAFSLLLRSTNGMSRDNSVDSFDEQMERNDIILQNQMEEIRQIDAKLYGVESPQYANEAGNSIASNEVPAQMQPKSVI